MTRPEFKIGQRIFYRHSTSHPLFINTTKILGETSRSWLVGEPTEWFADDFVMIERYAMKIPKTGKGYIFVSKEEDELAKWAAAIRDKIQLKIYDATAIQIRQIADILGYVEKEDP